MSEETKRWLVSSAVTFFAGFAVVILPALDTITLESLRGGVVVGLLMAGVRAGVKAVIEAYLAWYTTQK